MPEVSHNQLCATLTKACIGAGVSRGIAEDVAFALAGLSGKERETAVKELCEALDRFDNQHGYSAKPERREDKDFFSEANLLHNGPGLVELAMVVANNGGTLAIEQVDCPTCFRALVQMADMNGELERTPSGYRLKFEQAKSEKIVSSQPARAQVDRSHWATLLRHAQATMVPSDANSQADAGAGNSDND